MEDQGGNARAWDEIYLWRFAVSLKRYIFRSAFIFRYTYARPRASSRRKTKALVFYNNAPVPPYEKRIYLFKCHGDSVVPPI